MQMNPTIRTKGQKPFRLKNSHSAKRAALRGYRRRSAGVLA